MEVRSKDAGTTHVRVEIEFRTEKAFGSFADANERDHSRVELHLGRELSVELREDRTKEGRITVSFTVERAQVEKLTLRVMAAGGAGGSAYVVALKDFVEPKKEP
jgi:hypothetical protein